MASTQQKAPSAHEVIQFCTNKTSPWNDSSLALARTLGLPANEQSNQFFHSFLQGCLPSLTEAMDSGFWQRSILRASSSSIVQHAAIAFGAIYEQQLAGQSYHGNLDSSPSCKRLEILSSTHYAAAIRMLQLSIADSSLILEKVEEIMITCLLFIFMEILRGDDIAAATHLDGALKIYSCAQPNGKSNDVTSYKYKYVELEPLAKAFLRIDIESVLYMGSRIPWSPDTNHHTALWFQPAGDIPLVFDTFLDARDSLYVLLANIMNFVTPPEGAETCFPGWCPHPERGFDIYTIFHGSTYRDFDFPKASTHRREFMHAISRWKRAFQGFLQKGVAKNHEALAGCTLLWLVYYTTRINLAVSYTDEECCYDEQLPSFKKIIELVETHQKYTTHFSTATFHRDYDGSAGNAPDIKPKKKHFKVHSTVCYPLYYTALKCRYKPLRHAALEMLRNVESEGIWDAKMLARIAEFVISIEEETNGEAQKISSDAPQYGVPEINRIHCLSLNIVKSKRKIWFRYSRRKPQLQEKEANRSKPLNRWRIDNAILIWRDPTTETAEPPEPMPFVPESMPAPSLEWESRTLALRSSLTGR